MSKLKFIYIFILISIVSERYVLIDIGAKINLSYLLIIVFISLSVLYYIINNKRFTSDSRLYWIYGLLFTVIITYSINYGAISEYVKSLMQFIVFTLFTILITNITIHKTKLDLTIRFVTAIIILTVIAEYITKISNVNIPYLLNVPLIGPISYNSLSERAYGSFIEPNVLARTTVLLLLYHLKPIHTKKYDVFIITSLLLLVIISGSLNGLIFLTLALIILGYKEKIFRKYLRPSVIIGTVLLFIILLSLIDLDSFVEYLYTRVNELTTVVKVVSTENIFLLSSKNSSIVRVASNLLFTQLPFVDLFFGIGFYEVDVFAYSSVLTTSAIVSMFSWIIITSGIVGMLFYLIFFRVLYTHTKGIFSVIYLVHMISLFGSGDLLKPHFWIMLSIPIVGTASVYKHKEINQ